MFEAFFLAGVAADFVAITDPLSFDMRSIKHSTTYSRVAVLRLRCYVLVARTCGSNNNGKNCPSIFRPVGIVGTPSSSGVSEADTKPSRNALITTARRGCAV